MVNSYDNGFEYIELTNNAASAKIALQGAHLFHYQRVGEEALLWLSEVSEFEIGKAIRGGVPICWPSFGNNNPQLPQHGFARVAMWSLQSFQALDEENTQVIFVLEDSKQTREMWDYKFRVECIFTIGKELKIELKTTNLDQKAFELTQALHSYFAVSSIEDVKIQGLEQKNYLDALTLKQEIQEGVIKFDQEVDRVYQGVDKQIVLQDATRETVIINDGSKSVVIWNPWIDKSAKMSAMKPQGYKEFVCIESANAYDDKRELNPKEVHVLTARIS